MTPGDPLKFCQWRIGFIFTVMIYTTHVCSIKPFWPSPVAPSPSEPISQGGMSGTASLSAMERWEGMVDKSTAAEKKKKENYFDKREASPLAKPLRHGQDKQRRLHPGTKVLSLPWKSSALCPHISALTAPSTLQGTAIYQKPSLFAMSSAAWGMDCLH